MTYSQHRSRQRAEGTCKHTMWASPVFRPSRFIVRRRPTPLENKIAQAWSASPNCAEYADPGYHPDTDHGYGAGLPAELAKPAPTALIFDLDGVIIDSEPLHLQAGMRALERHGLGDIPFPQLHPGYRGRTDREMFWELVQLYRPQVPSDSELISSLIEAKAQVFSLLLAQVQLVDQVLPFLQTARQLYPRIGLTTSATARDQEQVFAQFQLHSWFDVVVTAADIARAKPDPEPYQLTTTRLQLPPEQCLVIEDSVAGIQSAKAAGCIVVGITTGLSALELWAGGADQVVDGFAELGQWLHLPVWNTPP